MYYSTVSLQVSVLFVAKSILHRKIKRSRGFSVGLQVGTPPAAKSFSHRRINRSRSDQRGGAGAWAECAARSGPPSPPQHCWGRSSCGVPMCQCRSTPSQKCVLCPWHAALFEQPPTGAANNVLRAPSNMAILHEILTAALLSSDATQGQSYNSHFCSTAPCRRVLAPRTRHRECSHHTQPARHSRDLKSSIASQQD